jgi:hypothetical protein
MSTVFHNMEGVLIVKWLLLFDKIKEPLHSS